MENVQPQPAGFMGKVRATVRQLSDLPPWAEPAIWIFLVAITIGLRLYLIHLLPVALWSKDAGSYAYSAFRWIHTGIWETDPRRGPIYSLLIAFCGKVWGSIYSLAMLQHAMGITAILLSIFALRLLHGRRALVPIALCGYAYAVNGLPLYLEHLVRNETILFFCGSVALVTWLFAIRWKQPHWLWITGIAVAILSATKNVWLPFPVLFIGATLWYDRKEMRRALVQVIIFAIAFGVPYMGVKVFKNRTRVVDRSDEPQEGVLLYGRTAQFTKLDGGIDPEIKAQIRDQVLAYQHEVFGDGKKAPKLNNNEILKKTVVPHLTKILRADGKNGIDLNDLCEKLAIEAIRTHPIAYSKQVLHDMGKMMTSSGVRYVAPDDGEVKSQLALLKELKAPDAIIDAPASEAKLQAIAGTPELTDTNAAQVSTKETRKHSGSKGRFSIYRKILLTSWMFDWAPVLLVTILLPFVWFFSPVNVRAWWVGGAGLWYFTLVLLSTVGRPLDRYLIPALPVMFFTISSALILAWNALAGNSPNAPVDQPNNTNHTT